MSPYAAGRPFTGQNATLVGDDRTFNVIASERLPGVDPASLSHPPQPEIAIPECPDELGPVAKREWDRLVGELTALRPRHSRVLRSAAQARS